MSKKTEHRAAGTGRRAALYIRVSSEEQARHGLSLEAQAEKLRQYAADAGLRIVDEYHDEGYSARKSFRSRPQFTRLLEDVRRERFDVILFVKLDRWFRNVSDYYEIQRILDEHQVSWIATEEDYDTTTANGRLHLNIKLSIAQDEADRTSERIKFVFESKVRRGEVISGKIPFGYRIENKVLAVDEEKAAIVRDAFARYLELRTVNGLRRYLSETYGILYSITGMKNFLQHPEYIGTWHGEPGACPSIVDPGIFRRVQELLEQRAQRTVKQAHTYLFTSLVFCAECGNRLSGHVVGGRYIYYRCTRSERFGYNCSHKHRTSELILESWLLENLIPACEAYNLSLRANAEQQPKKDPAKIKRRMQKLKDLYLNDLIELDDYKAEYESLRAQLEAETPSAPPPAPVDLEQIAAALPIYESLTPERKKAFWSSTIRRITITNDDKFIVEPISP